MKNTTIAVVAVLGLVLASYGVLKTTPVVNQNQSLGSVTGPDDYFPCKSTNGVTTCSEGKRFNVGSTTMASFLSPNATSTLRIAAGSITTATTTATQFEWGRSIFPDATSTSLGIYNLAASIKAVVLASTTQQSNGTAQTADAAFIIPPNTYVNLKAGNFLCTAGLTCSAIGGYAIVEFKY